MLAYYIGKVIAQIIAIETFRELMEETDSRYIEDH